MTSFMQDNRYYIGVNYWESEKSIRMWEDFDPAVIESDFQKLRACGVRVLRMFLVWPVFQPLKALWADARIYEYRMDDESPLPDTEAGWAGVSEEACQHFEIFCQLAEKYELGLIVGLITGHMSFRHYAPEAFAWKNFLTDPTCIKWETRFVRYFVKRFRNEKSIVAWDLGNECKNYGAPSVDQGYVWMHAITAAIRASDTTRPVVSGFDHMPMDGENFNVRETAELCDILTTHPYQIFSGSAMDPVNTMRPTIDPAFRATLYETMGGKPAFVEEVGSIGYTNCSEKTEAAFLRTMLWSTFAQGSHGCFWWCAFDQGQLDYAPYDWNNYGSDYGLYRADGSAKPVAKVTKEFDEFLSTFPYAELPRHSEEAVCIVSREVNNPNKLLPSAYILAKQANLDLRFAHAEDKLPDAKLYIWPSIFSAKPMFHHRMKELLEKIRAGATLYFSLGDTLFRRLPELTGLTIASREAGYTENVTLGEDQFSFPLHYRYNIEDVADTCEVLATGADGRPVFVKNRYGDGNIYFCAFPLEHFISERPGVFKNDKCKPYYRFYEAFAAEASADRAAVSHSLCVLLTEHSLCDNRRLVIAVNYSDHDVGPGITLKDGWKITKTYHGGETIAANDAAVFEIAR